MPAVIVLKGSPPRILQKYDMCEQNREPRLCACELVQLAIDGCFPADHRLEHLLDRFECLP